MEYNIKIYLPAISDSIEIHWFCRCSPLLCRCFTKHTYMTLIIYHLQFDRSIHMPSPNFTNTTHFRCDMTDFETISIITCAKQFYSKFGIATQIEEYRNRVSSEQLITIICPYHYVNNNAITCTIN